MESLSMSKKTASFIFKLTVIIAAVSGTFLSAFAGRGTFMGGNRVFMYFTIQSNIAIAIICALGLRMLMREKAPGTVWYTVKLVGTVAITLTGVVFAVMLAPILGDKAWNLQNTLTHVVVPLAAAADYFVTVPGAGLRKKDVIWVLIPPLFYVIYAGIGYVRGWEFAKGINYPYFFLNWGSPAGAFGFTKGFPFMGCVWWILVLMVFLIAVGLMYIVIADLIGKRL